MTGQGPLSFIKSSFIKETISSWSWVRDLVAPKPTAFVLLRSHRKMIGEHFSFYRKGIGLLPSQPQDWGGESWEKAA